MKTKTKNSRLHVNIGLQLYLFIYFFQHLLRQKKKKTWKKKMVFLCKPISDLSVTYLEFLWSGRTIFLDSQHVFFKLNIYDSFFIFYYIFLVTFVSVWMRHSLIINESACQPCNIYAFLTLLRSISWKKAVLHWHFHHFKIYDIVSMSLILLVSFCFVQNFQITQHETIASAAILLSLQ